MYVRVFWGVYVCMCIGVKRVHVCVGDIVMSVVSCAHAGVCGCIVTVDSNCYSMRYGIWCVINCDNRYGEH